VVTMNPSLQKCRYGCGADVYRFTDVGIPRQVEYIPVYVAGDQMTNINTLWRYRGKHVGWIPCQIAPHRHIETVYIEHDCDNTPRHLKPARASN
jgi:hypothetical protein